MSSTSSSDSASTGFAIITSSPSVVNMTICPRAARSPSAPKRAFTVHEVGEGVVLLRHALDYATAGVECKVQINDRRHRSRSQRARRELRPRSHAPLTDPSSVVAVGMCTAGNLLIARLHHLILSRQVTHN